MHFEKAYRDKTVLLTGHTGFKGSWLCEWLSMLGAEVVGFSLPDPPTEPSHFAELGLAERLGKQRDRRADVRSLQDVQRAVDEVRPDYVFHLAAQPIVRLAFDEPHRTVETNLVGSLNVLEAVRRAGRGCIVIMITTDKVYENAEWVYAYREEDALGGLDPYSASKACAELVISSWRRSFFERGLRDPGQDPIALASVRGGNVVGGGDWALDRIVPDSVRSLSAGAPIPVRNRHATRPWQHVLELLGGYMHLGALIDEALNRSAGRDVDRLEQLCSCFNFGPHITSNRPVEELVRAILENWPGEWNDLTKPDQKHEAGMLNLTIDKAYHLLGWQPAWDFEETIRQTIGWYSEFYASPDRTPASVTDLTRRQIRAYDERLQLRL
jgi:CDP-glucose 4,6-dehydratase